MQLTHIALWTNHLERLRDFYVKYFNGMTTGQLDENALFYMQSRGIPRDEARMLLSVAFTSDVIDHVRLEALKDRLHKLVEKRFRGELAKCAGCRICK